MPPIFTQAFKWTAQYLHLISKRYPMLVYSLQCARKVNRSKYYHINAQPRSQKTASHNIVKFSNDLQARHDGIEAIFHALSSRLCRYNVAIYSVHIIYARFIIHIYCKAFVNGLHWHIQSFYGSERPIDLLRFDWSAFGLYLIYCAQSIITKLKKYVTTIIRVLKACVVAISWPQLVYGTHLDNMGELRELFS